MADCTSSPRESTETRGDRCRLALRARQGASRIDNHFLRRNLGTPRRTISRAPREPVPRRSDPRESQREPPDSEVPRRSDKALLRLPETSAHSRILGTEASPRQSCGAQVQQRRPGARYATPTDAGAVLPRFPAWFFPKKSPPAAAPKVQPAGGYRP